MSPLRGSAGEMLCNTGMPGRILVIRSANRNLVSCLRTLRMFVRCDIPAISLMGPSLPLRFDGDHCCCNSTLLQGLESSADLVPKDRVVTSREPAIYSLGADLTLGCVGQ